MPRVSATKKQNPNLIEVPLSRLKSCKWSRIRQLDDGDLEEEVARLKQSPSISPLVIRKAGSKSYEIVTGEVRFQAAKKMGLGRIPCMVRTLSEGEARQLSLLESLDQPGITPLDEADILAELMEAYGLRQSELAVLTGRSKTQISRTVRISSLPEEMKKKIRSSGAVLTRAQLIEASEHPDHAEWIIAERPTLREIRMRIARDTDGGNGRSASPARTSRSSRRPSSACAVSYDEFEDGRGFRLKVHFDQTTCTPEKKEDIIHTLKVALFLLGELDLQRTVWEPPGGNGRSI